MSPEDWITTQEASKVSGYNEQYVRRLIRNGKLKARKFGPVWQVNRADLLAYMKLGNSTEDRRRGPRSAA